MVLVDEVAVQKLQARTLILMSHLRPVDQSIITAVFARKLCQLCSVDHRSIRLAYFAHPRAAVLSAYSGDQPAFLGRKSETALRQGLG